MARICIPDQEYKERVQRCAAILRRACRHQTSVTAGTLMHRTHLPLTAWFWAIYLCATDKRGISAVQLSRTLGICYESA